MFSFLNTPKFVINLERRNDRLAVVMAEFKKHNLRVTRWNAIDCREVTVPEMSCKGFQYNAAPIYACALSHLSLLKHAVANSFPYIAIFEDDVVLCDNFMERAIKAGEYEWDIFYLGGHGAYSQSKCGDITYISGCAGTYAYIMSLKACEFTVRNWNYHFGMDEFYSRFLQGRFKTAAFIPFLAGTYPNVSDVAMHFSDYKIDPV